MQRTPGTYKSNTPNNITGVDKFHLRCDCVNGSIVNGIPEPISYSFALHKPPSFIFYIEPRFKIFKKLSKSVFSHINFYFEDDDRKPVVFEGETISFTCQLIKI